MAEWSARRTLVQLERGIARRELLVWQTGAPSCADGSRGNFAAVELAPLLPALTCLLLGLVAATALCAAERVAARLVLACLEAGNGSDAARRAPREAPASL